MTTVLKLFADRLKIYEHILSFLKIVSFFKIIGLLIGT